MDCYIKKANKTLEKLNSLIEEKNNIVDYDGKIKAGVDLGTANLVLTLVDQDNNPLAALKKSGKVVRDGLVVDYIGALKIVREMKNKMENILGREVLYAATAVPPGTGEGDVDTFKNVVEGAGFQVSNVIDEPSAAATVLEIERGIVVDIGGGTTGISILEDGEVVYTADEATGGTHLNLVIAGGLGISVEEAEKMKENPKHANDIFPMTIPVIEKIASIINKHIKNYKAETIYLVGGTSSIEGIENVLAKKTGLKVVKPSHTLLVTPLGIAMNCK
ncbi:MAG: ethanolamine utilization protein EutJ [Halanaerobium sp. 4-GBenrich]|jgi:ethanolamine utilization protein EutJ|uniref:Chaperone protein DnaK n=1 Tax=Halanaerobium congolense TaxID=54121 RepID=A0A1G6L4B1_9FIRM|nr:MULTISPECIES: ethanolamine utilization protein EutJ [Halanaerobium]KXS48003.1 MAG: ethanolamine utilization protein EutJ [Halanaerobium sp. T82-1]ODS50014.1 MAG: ethanolamine utilization protein EutJ [Halanaerobium sp. 4-GBenrich]PUU86771.1 MAG: ethanolamine utilization protein EutJ [Halanaerobium sp.]PUU88208.1 MAG: ethanolamine utilization protein EutJ [Halanaerobium sp.]TDP14376.1 ethanolamine utilization protein EutJ [Halanaerobium congolense]